MREVLINYTMKLYVTVLAAVFIIACNSPANRVSKTDSVGVLVSDSAASEKSVRVLKGLYTFGNEVNTFQDCSNKKVYWVNDSLASLRDQYEKINRFPSYPYESVYAEVKGYLSGKSKMRYASDYENVLVVTDIIKIEAKNFKTDCYHYEFIAIGNEPFWSLDIIPEEKKMVLKDVGEEKVYEFIYSPANTGGGVYRYEAVNTAKDKLVVVIREEKCSDGMSDRQYNYSAEVTVNGRIYKGCAIKKGDKFTE